MKNYKTKLVSHSNSRGGVLVLVALLLVVFVGITALAIDIGYLSTTRNELQNVADAAALAGAGYLGSEYIKLPPSQHGAKEFTRSEIVNVVQKIAGENKAAKNIVSINDNATDIRIGLWNPNITDIDVETLKAPDAVYVKARRDTEANSPISTFFAGIFGIDTMPVTAEAWAALTGPSTIDEGELVTPFGISEEAFPNSCKDFIYFSPTTHSCAGWTNFESEKISGSLLSEKIFNLIVSDDCQFCDPFTTDAGLIQNGQDWLYNNFNPGNPIVKDLDTNDATPTTSAGVEFNFIGGETDQFNGDYLLDYDGNKGTPYNNSGEILYNSATSPSPIFSLFDYFRYRDGDEDVRVKENIYDLSGEKTEEHILYPQDYIFDKNDVWSTMVPVYEDDDKVNCDGVGTNVKGQTKIVGFAKVVVIKPNPPPSKDLSVMIDCEFSVVEGRGGGGTFGAVKGSIPNLVK